jgi:serine/threonine protein kinase
MADKLQNLVCPITFSFFVDPVVAEDGHTYERKAITDWIQRNGTSPLTRKPITFAGLRPNHIVKCLVNDFQSILSKRNYKFKLGVDIERSENPLFETTGKILYEAKWIGNPNGPPIALLILQGARAEKEASFYEYVTRHPNIVYTYGLVEYPHQHLNDDSDTFVALLQEMAPLRNLHNVLKHRVERHPNKPFSTDLINQIFLQITDAMIFLSEKNIIHGDLACRNVLVFRIDETEPKQTLVKLTDFGISRGNTIYSKIEAIATVIDTVPIRSSPPEVLQNNDNNTTNVYSEKSDMYAMGVLMWEIYSNGNIPWGKIAKESDIRQKVINGERLSRPENCKSDRQWELILKCMSQAPADRPKFVELKKQLTESIIPLTTTNKQVSHCYLIDIIEIRFILEFMSIGKHAEKLNSDKRRNR